MHLKKAGKPIKERGINWTETYGDKSAYLKREFEEQVGPGSYFRWEGHDYTTGTDYYVVVAPGFSKEHGYHFFAGLRKMPADHGASGKKFTTQREALSYAAEMWRVPKPTTMPPGWVGYQQVDIQGKSIVLEGTSEGGKSAATEKPVKVSWKLPANPAPVEKREAMSLRGSGNVNSLWQRRMGPKVLPSLYCWAYKCNQSMGFLSGLFSNMRFMGQDTMNFPASGGSGVGINLMQGGEGQPGKLPMAPMIAKPTAPKPERFQRSYAAPMEQPNRLISIKRKDGKAVEKVKHPQYDNPAAEGYNVTRWRDIPVFPQVSMNMAEFLKNKQMWPKLQAMNVEIPDWLTQYLQTGDQTALGKFGQQVPVQMRIDPSKFETAEDFYNAYAAAHGEASKVGNVVIRGNKEASKNYQRDFLDAIALSIENNEQFDLDEAYFENIPLSGPGRIVYSDVGLPRWVIGKSRAADDQQTNLQGAESPSADNLVFDDPVDIVDQHVDFDNGWDMGVYSAYMDTLNAPDMKPAVAERIVRSLDDFSDVDFSGISAKDMPTYDQMLKVAAKHYIQSAPTPEQIKSQLGAFKNKYATSAQAAGGRLGAAARQATPDYFGFKELYANWSQAQDLANSYYVNDPEKKSAMQSAADFKRVPVGIMLHAFQQLAGNNLVNVQPDELRVDSTCMPKLSGTMQETFNVNQQLLPQKYVPSQDGSVQTTLNKDNSQGIETAYSPYCPEYVVRLRKDKDAAGNPVVGARWWDEERGSWVYGPVDPNKHKLRKLGGYETDESGNVVENEHGLPKAAPGMRTVSTDTFMLVPGADGMLHKIKSGEMPLYDTKSEGIFPGNTYDLNAKASHETPKGTQNKLRSKGLGRPGFELMFEEHYAEENGGRSTVRQHNEVPFTGKDPEVDRDYYAILDENGTEVDNLADYTHVQRGDDGGVEKVFFTNTMPLLAWMKQKFNLQDWMIGGHTGMSDEDLRLIDEQTYESEQYYKAMNLHRTKDMAQDPNALGMLMDKSGRKMLPEKTLQLKIDRDQAAKAAYDALAAQYGARNMAELRQMFSDSRDFIDLDEDEKARMGEMAQKFAAEPFDEDKYNRGRVYNQCGGGSNSLPPEVLKALDESLANPEEAFKPKKGNLFGVQLVDETGQPVPSQGMTDDNGFVTKEDGSSYYFGSMLSAENGSHHPRVSNAVADATNQSGKKVVAKAAVMAQDQYLMRSFADMADAVRQEAIQNGQDPEAAVQGLVLTNGEGILKKHIASGDLDSLEEDFKQAFPSKSHWDQFFVQDDGAIDLAEAAVPPDAEQDQLEQQLETAKDVAERKQLEDAEQPEQAAEVQLPTDQQATVQPIEEVQQVDPRELETIVNELVLNGATQQELLDWAKRNGTEAEVSEILSRVAPEMAQAPGPETAITAPAAPAAAPVAPGADLSGYDFSKMSPSGVEGIFNMLVNKGVSPEQARDQIKSVAPQHSPFLDKSYTSMINYKQQMEQRQKARLAPPVAGAAVQRLVQLAERLDGEGRIKEADAVDRVIRATIERSRSANRVRQGL